MHSSPFPTLMSANSSSQHKLRLSGSLLAIAVLLPACSAPTAAGDWVLRWESGYSSGTALQEADRNPSRFAHGCVAQSSYTCRGPAIVRITGGDEGRYSVSVDGDSGFAFAVDKQSLVYETGVEPIPDANLSDAAGFLVAKGVRFDSKAVLPLALWTGRKFELDSTGSVLRIGPMVYDRLDDKARADGLLKSQKLAMSEALLERMFDSWITTMSEAADRFATWSTKAVVEVMTNEQRLGGMAFDIPAWFEPEIEEGGGAMSEDSTFQLTPSIVVAKLSGTSLTCSIDVEYRRAPMDAVEPIEGVEVADSIVAQNAMLSEITLSWQANASGARVFKCGDGRLTHAKAIAPIMDALATAVAERQRRADSLAEAKASAEREAEREKRKAERASESSSGGSSGSSGTSNRGPASEALKARCALEVDENAYAFFDGSRVDTRAWRQVASPRALQEYTRCLNLGR